MSVRVKICLLAKKNNIPLDEQEKIFCKQWQKDQDRIRRGFKRRQQFGKFDFFLIFNNVCTIWSQLGLAKKNY